MKSFATFFQAIFINTLAILMFGSCAVKRSDKAISAEVLEKEIPVLMNQALIPGLSIAVIQEGEIFWDQAFGVKSMETGDSVTAETIFEAASLSKPVFAYAVLRMVERGELELDKPLLEYVSDQFIEEKFLGRKISDIRIRSITARMVLSHQSGFPNWRQNDSLTFRFNPEEQFGYSGEGFGLLQRVVENITGSTLNEIVGNEVFVPLGMKHSSFNWIEPYEKTTSYPHNGIMEAGNKRKFTEGHAAANLHTTASDYGLFLMAIMNHTGLKENMVESMLSPQIVVDPDEPVAIEWGLGIGLERTDQGLSYWHWGDNGNFKCFCLADPEEKKGVVYFTNSTYGLAIREQVVELALGGNHPVLNSNLINGYGSADSPWMEFVGVLVNENIEAALERFHQLSKEFPPDEIIPEYSMNNMGYAFLGKEQFQTAISIFRLNTEVHPDSWNVYDSLGEAYMKSGDRESAISNYKRSLELNPENENAVQMLEKMEGD